MHISIFLFLFFRSLIPLTIVIWNSNNNNTLLNLVADHFPRLESKEIGPDIQKWIGIHMSLKANGRILMWMLLKDEDRTFS